MKLLIIPSWYPSGQNPYTGIFFKEQAQLLARHNPEWKIGISLWGSHEPKLWIRFFRPLEALIKLTSRFLLKPYQRLLSNNCAEFFTPAHTWSRHFLEGNIEKIIRANEKNLHDFIRYFGMPDMIQADIAYPAGWIAMTLSQKYNIPYFIKEHMSPFPLPTFSRDFKKRLIPPLQKANAVIAVGSNLRTELAALGVKAELGINFIDMDYFVRPQQKKDKKELKILALGRLEDQKGFDLLLSALQGMKEYPWQLRLGGSGTQARRLQRLSKTNKLDSQITFLGALDREAVKHEMQSCDFFVLPSRHESFGVVLIEAMACGQPLLVTRCGGITDSLPDQVAIKCDPNVSSLKEGLLSMFTNHQAFNAEIIRNYVEKNYSVSIATQQLIALKEKF